MSEPKPVFTPLGFGNRREVSQWTQALPAQVHQGGTIADYVAYAHHVGAEVPLPHHDAGTRWAFLATLGAYDLSLARVVEPHLDALAILGELKEPAQPGAYGVFAAGSPTAKLTATYQTERWVLAGTKPWCSVASHLQRALVTAESPHGSRLFDLDLTDPGITFLDDAWVAKGLSSLVTGSLDCEQVEVTAVGDVGDYLGRVGFGLGAISVAAVWFGAAAALADTLRQATTRREPDQVALMHLGAVDAALFSCECVLSHAAGQAAGLTSQAQAWLLASRTRAVVANACEVVLSRVAHNLGPAPLAYDAQHAQRVADLQLYVRQYHAERDEARLGALVSHRP